MVLFGLSLFCVRSAVSRPERRQPTGCSKVPPLPCFDVLSFTICHSQETAATLVIVKVLAMEQIEIRSRGVLGRRSPGAQPLPRRWLRARRWNKNRDLGTFDLVALKLMLAAENRGQG